MQAVHLQQNRPIYLGTSRGSSNCELRNCYSIPGVILGDSMAFVDIMIAVAIPTEPAWFSITIFLAGILTKN